MDSDRSPIHVEYTPKLKDPLIVAAFEGWNDGGQAASTAVRHLIETLNAEKFAWIDPEEYYVFTETRPKVKLEEGRLRKVVWHTNEFYHAQLSGADRDIVLLIGTEPHLKWRGYSQNVLDLVQSLGAKTFVTLGGFLGDTLYTLPVQISGFCNDASIEERFNLQRTNYEGPTGIVGVLSDFARQAELVTLSLWAAVPYYISIPNPKGAHALLNKLQEVFDFAIDLSAIEAEANTFDNEINNIVAKDPSVAAYVRELKKREFLN
ncbi:MAG: PAC2 family protein [SAR324 cluster bacterium]|nr:PAC2 family protein [SAR324 cluster bacterium]